MLETLIDTYGEGAVLMMAGLAVGVLFGAAAQHSRFCLRAAVAEVTGGQLGRKTASQRKAGHFRGGWSRCLRGHPR